MLNYSCHLLFHVSLTLCDQFFLRFISPPRCLWVRSRGNRWRDEIADKRAELRSLQDLRYQGPEPKHQLGGARRWRRTGLQWDVNLFECHPSCKVAVLTIKCAWKKRVLILMVQDVNSSAYLSESCRQDQNTTYFKKTDIYKSFVWSKSWKTPSVIIRP